MCAAESFRVLSVACGGQVDARRERAARLCVGVPPPPLLTYPFSYDMRYYDHSLILTGRACQTMNERDYGLDSNRAEQRERSDGNHRDGRDG